MNNVLLAMQEKLDWTQTKIAVDIAIQKDVVPGTVLNLSCAVIFFLESANVNLILSLDYYILTSVAYSSLCTPGATLRSVTDR